MAKLDFYPSFDIGEDVVAVNGWSFGGGWCKIISLHVDVTCDGRKESYSIQNRHGQTQTFERKYLLNEISLDYLNKSLIDLLNYDNATFSFIPELYEEIVDIQNDVKGLLKDAALSLV